MTQDLGQAQREPIPSADDLLELEAPLIGTAAVTLRALLGDHGPRNGSFGPQRRCWRHTRKPLLQTPPSPVHFHFTLPALCRCGAAFAKQAWLPGHTEQAMKG